MKTIILFLLFFEPLFVFGQITQIGVDIDGEAANDRSGASISFNNDGSIVAIWAGGNDGTNGTNSGHVRVFQNTGGTWAQVGQDIDGEEENDVSGNSVSLSADGSIVAIAAINNSGINGPASGHVRIYQNRGGTWTQIGADIDGEDSYDESGYSVSLSADGSIVAVGAHQNDGIKGYESGHVRVFDLSSVLGNADNSLSDFSVYPNPTTGVLTVQSKTAIAQIKIYTFLEQLVLSNTNLNTIDISSVSQGIYLIKIKDENGNVGTQKIVKE